MYEDFNFNGAHAADVRDFLARKFTREHDPRAAQRRRGLYALKRVDTHLRRGVDGRFGRDLFAELHHAQILHDERVHAERGRGADDFCRARHFTVGDQRIEREVYLHAAHMAVDDGLLQLVGREIVRVHTRVEAVISKIYGVCAVLYGGAQRLHGTGGGQ